MWHTREDEAGQDEVDNAEGHEDEAKLVELSADFAIDDRVGFAREEGRQAAARFLCVFAVGVVVLCLWVHEGHRLFGIVDSRLVDAL